MTRKNKKGNGKPKISRQVLRKALSKLPKKSSGSTIVVKETKIPIGKSYKYKRSDAKVSGTMHGMSAGISVTHTEYLQDLVTGNGSGFSIARIEVNPGLPLVFPWLSQMAPNFETFVFEDLAFHFIPNTNTTQKGAIMMVGDFDPTDPTPQNKKEMLNKSGCESGVVYTRLTYKPKKSDYNKQKSYYIRVPGQTVQSDDLKFYDPLAFFLAYNGTEPNSTLGEIHVSYKLKLLTPTLQIAQSLINKIETVDLVSTDFIGDNLNGAKFPFGASTITTIAMAAADLYLKQTGNGIATFSSGKSVSKQFVLRFSNTLLTSVLCLYSIVRGIGGSVSSQSGFTFVDESPKDTTELYESLINAGKDPLLNGFTDISLSSQHTILYQNQSVVGGGYESLYQFNFKLDPGDLLVFDYRAPSPANQIASMRSMITDYKW